MKGYHRKNFGYHTQDGFTYGVAILCNGQSVSEAILAAICEAAASPDAIGLLALLNSPEGRVIPRDWRLPEDIAVKYGHSECICVLEQCGYVFCKRTWWNAAMHGHLHCLRFAVNQNYPLDDEVFNVALRGGHVACMDYLIQLGLPRTPYRHFNYPLTADQLTCMELMLDKGTAVDPENLIWAAEAGDVDCVRALHKRGVPLWQQIWHCCQTNSSGFGCIVDEPGTPVIHSRPHYKEEIWKAMRYGSLHGAPVTRPLEKLFRWKRQRTHAVLCCFKAAARLSQRPGAAGALASMAAVPTVIVEIMIILADLEIPESVMKRPARQSAPARAQ